MLVLSRKRRETVVLTLGDVEVRISVNEIRGDKVRLSFEAPREVEIWREEVHKKRQKGGNDVYVP
jgi:carbon storage regulator CsrA